MSQNSDPHSALHPRLPQTWILREISEIQEWHRYAVAKALLDRNQRERDFIGRIVVMNETWARSYEPNLKCQSNELKHPGSPRPKNMRRTQCAVKMMFIVAYDIDEVTLHHAVPPRQTVNTA